MSLIIVRVQLDAHRGDEERGGDLLPFEHPQDPGEPVHRAVLAPRDHLVVEVARRERGGGVVDVEREADRDAAAAGPGSGLQALAGADVEHLLAELVERQPRARQRVGARGLGGVAPVAPPVARSRSGRGRPSATHPGRIASSFESWEPPLESGHIMPQIRRRADGRRPGWAHRAGKIARMTLAYWPQRVRAGGEPGRRRVRRRRTVKPATTPAAAGRTESSSPSIRRGAGDTCRRPLRPAPTAPLPGGGSEPVAMVTDLAVGLADHAPRRPVHDGAPDRGPRLAACAGPFVPGPTAGS